MCLENEGMGKLWKVKVLLEELKSVKIQHSLNLQLSDTDTIPFLTSEKKKHKHYVWRSCLVQTLFLKSLQINAYNLKGNAEDQLTKLNSVSSLIWDSLEYFFNVNKFYSSDKGIIKYTCSCNSRKAKIMNPISQGVVCGWIFRCVTR